MTMMTTTMMMMTGMTAMTNLPLLLVIIAVQAICAGAVIWDLLSSVVGFRSRPISWQTRELIEIGAAVGLVIGLIMGAVVVYRSQARTRRVEAQLRAASGAFMEVLEERFADWGLTAAERDVALFAIKGMSLSEIAALRQTSEGTVKAQTNAIYRKAGVSGRPQLLSLFIEDLMADPAQSVAAPGAA
ncbi:MAG: helix-turn-helix transcriptional regulator [Pseudomonadota bacterium]